MPGKLKKMQPRMTSGDKLTVGQSLRAERPRRPLPGQMSLTLADGSPIATEKATKADKAAKPAKAKKRILYQYGQENRI